MQLPNGTSSGPQAAVTACTFSEPALTALEAAEDTLRGLLAQHAAVTRPVPRADSRRLRAVRAANQDPLFDAG